MQLPPPPEAAAAAGAEVRDSLGPAEGLSVFEGTDRPPEFVYSGKRFVLGVGRDFYGIWDRRAPGPSIQRAERSEAGWRSVWESFQKMEPRSVDLRSLTVPPPPGEKGDGGIEFLRLSERYLLGQSANAFGIWDRQAPGPPLLRSPKTADGWRFIWVQYAAWAGDSVEAPADAPAEQGGDPSSSQAAPASQTDQESTHSGASLALEGTIDPAAVEGTPAPSTTCDVCGTTSALICAGTFVPHVPVPCEVGPSVLSCPICGHLPFFTCARCGARHTAGSIVSVPSTLTGPTAADSTPAAKQRTHRQSMLAQIAAAAFTGMAKEFGKEVGKEAGEAFWDTNQQE
jgi:hypothetical protein